MDLLKKLCAISAVTGDTKNLSQFIENYAKKHKIPHKRYKYDCVVLGNPKAEVVFTAHMDEVGVKVEKINSDGTLSISPVGWVTPNLLPGKILEFHTGASKVVEGVCMTKILPQMSDMQSFDDLYIHLGVSDPAGVKKLGIRKGIFGRYKSVFTPTPAGIFATSLDNRMSIYILLNILVKHPETAKSFAFGFTTYEEESNEGGQYLISTLKPKYVFVLDGSMYECATQIHDPEEKVIVDYQDGDFKLDKEIINLLKDIPHNKNYIKEVCDYGGIGSGSEPEQYQDIPGVKAAGILTLLYNYHNGPYFLSKEALANTQNFLYKLIKKLSK